MKPAVRPDHLRAGAEHQVEGVGDEHPRPARAQLLRSAAFTVARVPTGMNAGVSTSCPPSRSSPRRAFPSRAATRNRFAIQAHRPGRNIASP